MKYIFTLIALFTTYLMAQNTILWEYAGGNNIGGRSNAVLYDKFNQNHVWATFLRGGVYETFDNGNTWHSLTSYTGSPIVSAMVQNNSGHLFIGTGNNIIQNIDEITNEANGNGIYKSIDGGQTWNLLEQTNQYNFPGFTGVNSLFSSINFLKISPAMII